MKKIICTLTAVMMFFGTIAVSADNAETQNAKWELLCPRRVSLYCPDGYDGKNLKINNELIYNEDGSINGRTIINEAAGSQTISAARFKGTYVYGSRRWKNSFTYEFDFRVDTIEKQFILKIANASIRFAKDTQPGQYFIAWENDNTAGGISHPLGTIWAHPAGGLLQLGQTYHIRIEADMTSGNEVFVTFTDPETGRVHTSHKAHGANNSMADYVNTGKLYTFTISCVDPVSITTSNEEMYYESFFLTDHEVQAAEGESTVKAETTLVNATNDSFNTVPYLFVNVYDQNGVMVRSSGTTEAEVPKHTSADNEILTAKRTYSAETDISGLPDGVYTVKSCIWRSREELIALKEPAEKQITIKEGIITEVAEVETPAETLDIMYMGESEYNSESVLLEQSEDIENYSEDSSDSEKQMDDTVINEADEEL